MAEMNLEKVGNLSPVSLDSSCLGPSEIFPIYWVFEKHGSDIKLSVG